MPPPEAAAVDEEEEEDPEEEDPEELEEEDEEEVAEEEVDEVVEEEVTEEEIDEVVEEEVEEEEEVDDVVEEEVEEEEEFDEVVEEEVVEEEEVDEVVEEEVVEVEEVDEVEEEVEEEEEDPEIEEGKEPEENLQAEAEKKAEDKAVVSCLQPVKEEKGLPSPSSEVLRSLTDLQILEGALSGFIRRWNGLQNTLDFIQSSIDHRSKELDALCRPSPSPKVKESVAKKEERQTKPADECQSDAANDELGLACQTMGNKNLRRYIVTHLCEIDSLRRVVPAALRLAPDPAKLVFYSVGRFYLQHRRCYDHPKSDAINTRRASILLLELYILSGCASELNPSVKEDALLAANAWRNRIVGEGGVSSATAEDALGLVLFMASFGIPPEFGCMDIYGLLYSRNLRKNADVLRLSPVLLEKMPDIIKDIIEKDMYVEAVNLICAFGLEEKFPPLTLLSSHCKKSMKIAVEEQGEGQRWLRSLIEAKKHLAMLKSVVKCVNENKLDPSLFEGIEISEVIATTEKRISELEQNRNSKRPAEEAAKSEAKRPRPASAQASLGIHPSSRWHNGGAMMAAAGSLPVPPPTSTYHTHVSSTADGDGNGSSISKLYHFADYVP